MANPRRLIVYNTALEFTRLSSQIGAALPRGWSDLTGQLKRASASIVLNTAEGAGEFRAHEKARFYRMARRSATECVGVLDVIETLALLPSDSLANGSDLLDEIQAMLTQLIKTWESRA